MRFAQFFKAFWIFARRAPLVTASPWFEADGEALALFLASPTGQRLQNRLRAEIAAANERAALSQGNAVACGWALGYRGLLSHFETFSFMPEPRHAPEPGSFTLPAELAHLAP